MRENKTKSIQENQRIKENKAKNKRFEEYGKEKKSSVTERRKSI